MATRFLMGAAAAVAVLIAGLGAAGWTARDDARRRHEGAILAEDQRRFCRDLRRVVLPLTGGLGIDVDFEIPQELITDDITDMARMIVFNLDTAVIPGAPPALREPLQIVSEAANQAAEDLSVEPLTTADAERAIDQVVDWFGDNC